MTRRMRNAVRSLPQSLRPILNWSEPVGGAIDELGISPPKNERSELPITVAIQFKFLLIQDRTAASVAETSRPAN